MSDRADFLIDSLHAAHHVDREEQGGGMRAGENESWPQLVKWPSTAD
jgi:hypothetical protein